MPKYDDDTRLTWGDNDGDYLFGDPHESNNPSVDTREDENYIWHFNRSVLN